MAIQPAALPWRWAALLGFALLAPAALPAGGGDRRLPEVRRRERGAEPLVSGVCLALHCAPEQQAPVLSRIEPGVPVRVLRRWFSPDGQPWWQVEAAPRGDGRTGRGWLRAEA
jgi:hypothetical protein